MNKDKQSFTFLYNALKATYLYTFLIQNFISFLPGRQETKSVWNNG